jgi:hypothetical protein
MDQRKPTSTSKNQSCRKYSFKKLSQFPQGNNVLDAEAYNIYGFLWRVTYVSSTQLNRPIWMKTYLCLEKPMFQEVFPSKSK